MGSGEWGWVALTGLGLAALAAGAIGLAASALLPPRCRHWGRTAGLAALGGSLALALLLHGPPWPTVAAAAGLGLAVLVLRRGGREPGTRTGPAGLVASSWPWALLLAAGAGLFGSGLRLLQDYPETFVESDSDHFPSLVLLQGLAEDPTASAWTDRGRKVRLLLPPDVDLAEGPLHAQERELERSLALRLIRTAPPDWRSDCHGWTFADGRWWVYGADVALILEDNGYRPVTDPAPGDLAVYRDLAGTITHTGVVFAASPGRPVLVESKWTWLGCYVHTAQDQPYGTVITYYRTDRGSHRLRGLNGRPLVETATRDES